LIARAGIRGVGDFTVLMPLDFAPELFVAGAMLVGEFDFKRRLFLQGSQHRPQSTDFHRFDEMVIEAGFTRTSAVFFLAPSG
jgi:hypothetical protein